MRGTAHELFLDAADAADEILGDVFKIDVAKSLDPLKTKDFEKIVASLGGSLAKIAVPAEDSALKKAVAKLDVNWTELSPEARSRVIQEAQKYLGAPFVQAVLPKMEQKLSFFTSDFVEKVKKNAVHTYDLNISPHLSATDERIAQFARTSQSHYIRNELGEREENFSLIARHLVGDGLDKGHGSAEIAERLATTLTAAKRSPGYWTMIAMVFATRARTSTQLFSFGEAGIEFYTWESVLDEATSMQCRFMHGRRFSVQGSIKSVRDVEEASENNPEAIRSLQPFMNLSGDSLYAKIGTSKIPIATVTENVVGQKDKIGSFAHGAWSTDALASAGMHMPPIHGHCRSTVIPDFSGAPAPAKPVPAAPVPGAPIPGAKPHGESKENKDNALAACDKASQGGVLYNFDVFAKEPLAMQPYTHLGDPAFLDAHFASVQVSKKPKLDELVPTSQTGDAEKTKSFIKSSKLLDAQTKPVVVKFGGQTYIHSGQEVLAAQKLLGQKVAYANFVDLDKFPPPPVPAKPPPPPPLAHPIGIHDPNKAVVWGKFADHEGKELNGVKIAPLSERTEFWKHTSDVDVGEPHLPPLKPGHKYSSGVVMVEPDGRVWIFEPKDHFGGYNNTFPKGKTEVGLTHQQNALKEAFEESGLHAEITGYLGDFEGQTSNTRYYVARRVGGAPWKAGEESQAVKLVTPKQASMLLNTDRDKAILAKLGEYQAAPSPAPHVIVPTIPKPPAPPPPVAPALGPPPAATKADVILGTKVGTAQGSNAGGFYVGKDGVKRYVKFYGDAAQAPGEHLANMLYKDLGHGAAESVVFEHDGKTAYASVVLEGVETLGSKGITKERAEEAMKGFVADCLTANWDAAGTGFDNMVITKDGKLLRIDNGGTFLMRAKNGRKSESVLNTLSEWESMFNPAVNDYYAKLAKAAGYDEAADMKKIILPQIKAISELRDAHGGWAGYVEKHASMLPAGDKKKIVNMLESRTTLLEAKAVELKKPAPPKPKKLPPGAPIVAEYGKVQKPPKRDDDNLAIDKFEHLPRRPLPAAYGFEAVPPTGEDATEYRRKAKRSMSAIEAKDSEAHAGLVEFTGGTYRSIRKLVAKAQMDGDTTSYYGRTAHAIERAFEMKIGQVKGQTFRGFPCPREVIDAFMMQDEIGLLGIASTSRDPDVAVRFMGGRTGSSTRVFLVVHGKTGLPIETISGVGSELEILASGRARYRVLNRHRAADNEATLIMEIEEIEGSVDQVKPSEKPKPPKMKKSAPARFNAYGLKEAPPNPMDLDPLPREWPTHVELDGKQVDLAVAKRTLPPMVLCTIEFEVGGEKLRPWRQAVYAIAEDGSIVL